MEHLTAGLMFGGSIYLSVQCSKRAAEHLTQGVMHVGSIFLKKKLFIGRTLVLAIMQTISIPKAELEQLHGELETLRNSGLYKRLLEFEKNIAEGKRFTRKGLGF